MSLVVTDWHQTGWFTLVREHATHVTRDLVVAVAVVVVVVVVVVACDVTRDVDSGQPMSGRRVDELTHQASTRHRYNHQWINQSINQSINHSVTQSISQNVFIWYHITLRFSVLVITLCPTNKVNRRQARLVLVWMTSTSRYVTRYQGQLSLATPPWVGAAKSGT